MLNSQSLSRQNFFITLGLALTMALIALNQAGAAEDVRKLRLAYSGWEIGTAVAYIGVDAGLFKKHGLEIEELPIRDTLTAGVQSLIGVDLLIGFGNPLAVLQPVANGSDITVIGSHVSFDQYGMGVGSTIGSLKDLKGKKVGVSALGARSDLVARVILRRAGLDPSKDVEMVAAGLAPARALALSKNLVQGVPLNQVRSHAQGMFNFLHHVPAIAGLFIDLHSLRVREAVKARHPAAPVPDSFRGAVFSAMGQCPVSIRGCVGKFIEKSSRRIMVSGTGGTVTIDRSTHKLHVACTDGVNSLRY